MADLDSGKNDCLVTGSSGFIGRELVAALESSGIFRRVVCLDAIPGGHRHEVIADITKPLDPAAFGPDPVFSHCVHLAAVAKEPGYPHDVYYRTNHLGTRHVLDLCTALEVTDLIFTSTMMTFPAGDGRYDEADPVAPDTNYGGSKALAELEVFNWASARPDRHVAVLRPAVVFGPGDPGNFTRMRKALARRAFFYIGTRDVVKSCIHIDDVVGMLLHLIAARTEESLFHLAFAEPTTLEEIVDAMFNAFGGRYWIPTVPYRLARAASHPFVWAQQLGLDTGIHPRRIDKLRFSTNIAADRMDTIGYERKFRTVGSACEAWAQAELRSGTRASPAAPRHR